MKQHASLPPHAHQQGPLFEPDVRGVVGKLKGQQHGQVKHGEGDGTDQEKSVEIPKLKNEGKCGYQKSDHDGRRKLSITGGGQPDGRHRVEKGSKKT